jgi:CRP/FNR family transcriptional regulator, cyclic AMP receptor protein
LDIRLYFKNQEPVTHQAGDVLFWRGDPGDRMYIVKDGTVTITYGDHLTVEVGAGETFGEMALIDGHARSGDAVASTDLELYPVSRSLFLVLVQETPYFAIEVMKSLTERLRRANGEAG